MDGLRGELVEGGAEPEAIPLEELDPRYSRAAVEAWQNRKR